jgi:hypothetical protein
MNAMGRWNWLTLLGDRADECRRHDGFRHLGVPSARICAGAPAQSIRQGGGSPTSVCPVRPHADAWLLFHQEGRDGLPADEGGAVLGPTALPFHLNPLRQGRDVLAVGLRSFTVAVQHTRRPVFDAIGSGPRSAGPPWLWQTTPAGPFPRFRPQALDVSSSLLCDTPHRVVLAAPLAISTLAPSTRVPRFVPGPDKLPASPGPLITAVPPRRACMLPACNRFPLHCA